MEPAGPDQELVRACQADPIGPASVRANPPPNLQPARNTWRDRAIETGIVQGTQERDEILLPPSAHIQLSRQRVDLIRIHLKVDAAPAAAPATPSAATDPLIEIDHVRKRPQDTVVHVRRGRTQVTERRRAEGVSLVD